MFSTLISAIASTVGAEDAALRLALTLIAGYPLALLYRRHVITLQATYQHAYFTLCGCVLLFFNFGWQLYHSALCILVAFALCNFLPGTKLSAFIAYVFFTAYLAIGYYVTATTTYDILWTLPHCILTLRLIGLVMDVYDGHKPADRLSVTQRERALDREHLPSLLEVFGYSYFFGSFLIGPQYPLVRYRKFVNGEFYDRTTKKVPDTVYPAMVRFLPGVGFMLGYQVVIHFIPSDYLLTDQFADRAFLTRWFLFLLWFRAMFARYQSVWMVTEGICILAGLSYNGTDANGNILWDGVRDVRMRGFERATNYTDQMASFNVNTNKWAAEYIFKRLKFLGNKLVSQLATLMYLALWHGLHSGYYVCFAIEFVVVVAERQTDALLAKLPRLSSTLSWPPLRPLVFLFRRTLVLTGTATGFTAFELLKNQKYLQAYANVSYVGFIIYLIIWPIFYLILLQLVKQQRRHQRSEQSEPEKSK